MNFKEQRKIMLKFLFDNLDFSLLNHDLKYNNEKVEYKCNKCGKETKNENFYFTTTRIKTRSMCNCHESNEIKDLDMFKLSFFYENYKEMQEDNKEELRRKNELIQEEHKYIVEYIIKNRSSTYKKIDDNYLITCSNKHTFKLSFDDLINGKKWCSCKLGKHS